MCLWPSSFLFYFIYLNIQSSTDTNICFRLQPPFDPTQAPPPCPPWNSHEGMWNEQRDPNWSGPRDGGAAGPWSSQNEPPPSWSGQFDQPPWSSQPDQPPWGQREPPFRMQRPPHFRGPFPPHQQPPPFNQPPPHNFGRFPPRFMQDEFPPRHHFERPPYPPHQFDYPQGDFPGGETSALLFAKLLEIKITLIHEKCTQVLVWFFLFVFCISTNFHFSILNCINMRVLCLKVKKLRWQ